ncbi:TPA: helix-turn-helix domain-containing protein [Escherichia coli]|nr:helix-turn-helix domain-containing protein [Escherichia coli]
MAYELQDRAFRLLIDDRNVSYILITLAWYADHDKNQCYPSIDTLARRCHIKRDSVIAAIKVLERYGVLSRKRRYNTSSIYKFSEKFKEVVQKDEDMSIEDFILAEEVKVPRGGLSHIPAEEVKVPRGGLSFTKSKSLEGDSNKVVKYINKEDKKNNLISFSGEDEEVNGKAQSVLDHYNDKFNCRYRERKYFATLLKETKSRKAYTPDEIMLVIDWVAETWSFQPEPVKITRVSRFDGYLSQAEEWKANRIDYEMIVSEYNYVLGEMLGPEELTPAKKSKINKIIAHINKSHDPDTWNRYFCAAGGMISENPFYMGENNSGWVASFDWLMKPETLEKVRTYARQHAS